MSLCCVAWQNVPVWGMPESPKINHFPLSSHAPRKILLAQNHQCKFSLAMTDQIRAMDGASACTGEPGRCWPEWCVQPEPIVQSGSSVHSIMFSGAQIQSLIAILNLHWWFWARRIFLGAWELGKIVDLGWFRHASNWHILLCNTAQTHSLKHH